MNACCGGNLVEMNDPRSESVGDGIGGKQVSVTWGSFRWIFESQGCSKRQNCVHLVFGGRNLHPSVC
jgi:hypothetical protein